jgi:transposase
MCELLVGLPAVTVLGVEDTATSVVVHVELRTVKAGCPSCGVVAWMKDRATVDLVDLPAFGRPARLVWHKHRWCCPDRDCPVGSFTGEDARIAPARAAMTDRAGRWATEQVGRLGRTVAEAARDLGFDWHKVNDAVVAYGAALIDDDPERIGAGRCPRARRNPVLPAGPVADPAVVHFDRGR